MSMHWSGNMVLGCLLAGSDIDYFMQKYIELNPDEFAGLSQEDAVETMEEWMQCSEEFRCADQAGDPDAKKFYAQEYTDDAFEGLFFMPAHPESNDYESVELPCILVSADKWLGTRCIFQDFYNSYSDLLEEFRAKLGKYLPDNFDYDANIGDLSYACFA